MRISDWSSDVCSSDLPADVDTAQLYDGFSFQALAWIESLGFCEIGDGGKYIEGGQRIALAGELPLNTFGGQIGAGRLHGFGFAHEAVTQLRGNGRSEEHTSELQSLMRNSYAVFCLKKKIKENTRRIEN